MKLKAVDVLTQMLEQLRCEGPYRLWGVVSELFPITLLVICGFRFYPRFSLAKTSTSSMKATTALF